MTRNGALDILKAILALTVIGMHTGFLTDVSPLGAYLTSNGLFRAAVPLFLLINGYFFYNVVNDSSPRRWFKRVAVLYAVWMVIYLPYWLPSVEGPVALFAARSLRTIFLGYYHLWYLSGMIGAAALLVLLARRSTKALLVVAVATFSTGVAIQYASNLHLAGDGSLAKLLKMEWAARNFLFLSFPFFCFGYLIRKHKLQERFTVQSAAVFTVAGAALLLIETASNFYGPAAGAPFDNLASLAVVCPAVFILFMKLEMPVRNKEIALYSTAIYLVHILVMNLTLRYAHVEPTMLTVTTTILAISAAYFLVKVSRRIPFLL